MKKKILVISIVSLFLLASLSSMSIIGMEITTQNNENDETPFEENDADVPIWEVGHSWKYDITVSGGLPPYISISNFKFDDLTFTVDEVTDESYIISYSADVSGSFSVKVQIITLSGKVQETDIEGSMIVNKSSLIIDEVLDSIVDGYIKPNILPKFHFSVEGNSVITYYGPSFLNFPLNNGDAWYASGFSMDYSIEVSLFPDPIEDTFFIEGNFVECQEWEIVNVPAGEYDALKLSGSLGSQHNVWYSVAAGNVIKMRSRNIPFNGGYSGDYDIDVDLQSTNFYVESDPPSTPSELTGPSEVIAGYPEEFTAGGSIDPDGDMVRYIFDWGDGTITGTDFVPSGESASAEKYWTQKGEYSIKVKARDKYGEQSEWSDPITVTVTNDPPITPDPPAGPPQGTIKKYYTYSATSMDPEGHRIRFKFSWGDGSTSYSGYVNSGETGSAGHSWGREGTYKIKVMAIDEYGEESGWSEPLTVVMPREKTINNLFLKLKDSYPYLFSILQQLLQRLGL